MVDEIIALLPSRDLKNKIRETNRQFSDAELLQIICGYAPDLETRIAWLDRFSKQTDPETASFATAYRSWLEKSLERFMQESDGFVFELHIKDTPDSADECYLCGSYPAARKLIDLYHEEYAEVGAIETEKTRYRIVKRELYTGDDRYDFEIDPYSECVLGAEKTVLTIEDYKHSEEYCGSEALCSECNKLCPWRADELMFPCFARDRDLIRYHDQSGKECFGMSLLWADREELACYYVIPLDSDVIRSHQFEEADAAHQHVALPLAEIASVNELRDTMRKDYIAFMEYLDAKDKK